MILSIIIPVYNNFKQLSKCLRSLQQQTVFSNEKYKTEVIVVDDGSKHLNTETLKHLNTELNIQFYKVEHSGASAARNFGYTKSSGQYIFFCDADVVFLKNNALEKMILKLKKNQDKAYCYSSFKYGFKIFKCGQFDPVKLKQNNDISTMSVIRRSAIDNVETRQCLVSTNQNKPFDTSLKRFQDWDLWLTLLEHDQTGIWLPEVLWQAKSRGTMSTWLPKIFYKLFKNSKKVKEYKKAKEIVKRKHRL